MIELRNVSTERFLSFLRYNLNDSELRRAYQAMINHGIKDFQTLKSMVANGRKEFNNEFFKNAIVEVEKNINHANEYGREPVLFFCNDYEGSSVFKKTLRYTDKHTMCDVLLCKTPGIAGYGKFGILKEISVYDAKELLKRVTAHDKSSTGNNAFVESMRRINIGDAKIVRDAINFYETQVLRQADETKKRGINLFELNKREKEFIVNRQIENIVKYLVENADLCVWGELSSAQKSRLVTAVASNSGYENKVIRKQIVEIITNYTTLSELKDDVVKQKTLDRFIIK